MSTIQNKDKNFNYDDSHILKQTMASSNINIRAKAPLVSVSVRSSTYLRYQAASPALDSCRNDEYFIEILAMLHLNVLHKQVSWPH